MKKLLFSAAICGLALSATPAHAQVELELGGFFKGYGVFSDQDDDSTIGGESRDFDIIRHTEIHMGGETTLDNGLTVGAWFEMEADGDSPNGVLDGSNSFDVEESYVYFSGNWGRVNFGAEDGAAYLLQVAAPSADSNVDGIRTYVTPVNYDAADATILAGRRFDYDQNPTSYADKLTYLSPIFSGFQVGVSYVPDVADASDSFLENEENLDGILGSAYEASFRYEGQFNNVGVNFGGGYTNVALEDNTTNPGGNDDDRSVWNLGLDLDIGPFGVGFAYMEDDYAENNTTGSTESDEETMVVGVDYTSGPFKLGASYFEQENTGDLVGTAGAGIDTSRWTGGVVYNYGPGMTFRGSVSRIHHEDITGIGDGGDSAEGTSLLVGTDISF